MAKKAEGTFFDDLVVGEQQIGREKRRRSKDYVQRSELHPLVPDLEKEGWEPHGKPLKTRTRLRKDKAHDEKLEDSVWVLMATMGFSELSKGRQFKIHFKRRNEVLGSKQIDVFAKDEETCIVVECKSSADRTKRSLQKDIEEFANLKGKIANSIKSHYGPEYKPKILWAFATHNIEWSEKDRERAAGENIAIISERDLRYFHELARHLGSAARFQFLANFFGGQKIPEMSRVKVPAVRGRLGGHRYYSFVVTPERLLKIAFVNHRTLNDPRGYPSYQRLVSKTRVREIGKFLEKGGYFPNNLIINFVKKPQFELLHKDEETGAQFGHLILPDYYKSAWVIDGQHRLYGFSEIPERAIKENLLVLAFEELERPEEADLFITINNKQKSVPRTLLDDLQGEIKWGSENPGERIKAICARILQTMREDFGEAFFEKIVVTGYRADTDTPLTIPSLVDSMRKSSLFGQNERKLKKYVEGPLCGRDDWETVDRARHVLNDLFGQIAQANPRAWRAGADEGLCTNATVGGFFLLFSEACRDLDATYGMNPLHLKEESLVEELSDYLEPIIAEIEKKKPETIRAIFKQGIPYGSNGPTQVFMRLVSIVRKQFDHFGPSNFEVWARAQDEDRQSEAREKVMSLNQILCQAIFDRFKEIYADDYWNKGVSNKEIRKSAYSRQQDDPIDKQGSIEDYLDFIELKKIVETKENWDLFKPIFDIPLPDEKGRAKNLKWMDTLNELRRPAAHRSETRKYTDEDIELIDYLFDYVEENISAADAATGMGS